MITRNAHTIARTIPRKVAFEQPNVEVPAWFTDALCAQVDQDGFYPDKGGSTANAKATCARCVVREQCLEYALANDERYGIWGGTSEGDRRKIRRARKLAAAS